MFCSIVIFAVGSALCGAAPSMNFLIAGRGTYPSTQTQNQLLNYLYISKLCKVPVQEVLHPYAKSLSLTLCR